MKYKTWVSIDKLSFLRFSFLLIECNKNKPISEIQSFIFAVTFAEISVKVFTEIFDKQLRFPFFYCRDVRPIFFLRRGW